MTVIVLERVPVGVRGELTRWMLEIHTGVFVGSLSARVRDLLWDQVCDQMCEGAGFLVYQTNNEQGFALRSCGRTDRRLIQVEGLFLVKIPS
ncbi:MAG: type I-E CRISPR-associated endoribonuclease Cas2e [Oscillochloridaceae bacterium]|nr:type I-E CRISPR-associated endoribonuclease Cas2e [Chloroflexaceae bacterium]MDW8392425.1 type I-E CRISPR-associated endoribonuclease Cas2e [Oscillochloridaceae bacterium]